MKHAAAVVLAVAILFGGVALELPQCDMEVFERANPGLCDDRHGVGPFPQFPNDPDGEGGNGGLIGRILDGIGGLLGGGGLL